MRRSLSSRLSILAALGSATACSQSTPPAPPRVVQLALPHTTSRFANGLRLVVAPEPTSDLVHVSVRYEVGSSADPAGKAGLAHLVEHLTFLARQGGVSLGSRLERVAVGFNAFTSVDATHYYAVGRADQIVDLLAIEARRITIQCDQIDEASFARELAVVRSELRTGARHLPDVWQAVLEAAYEPGHPFRRPTIGFDGELAGLTRVDACAFLRDHYAADRAIVVVTGRVDPKSVETMVGKLFARAPARARGVVPAVPPGRARRARVEVTASVDRPTLVAAWLVPPRGHPDRNAVDMAFGLMAGTLAQEGGWHFDVSSGAGSDVGRELYILAVELQKDRTFGDAEMAVLQANLNVRSGLARAGFSSAVFGRLTEAVFALDSMDERAFALAEALQRGASGRQVLGELRQMERTTLDEIRAAANHYFDQDRMIQIRVRPGGTRIEQLVGTGYRGESLDRSGEPVTAAEADQPLAAPVPAVELAGIQRVVLDQGLEVILAPSPAVPTFTARMVFRAGTSDDAQGGVAAFGAVHGLRVELPWGPMPAWGSYQTAGGRLWRRVGRDFTELGVEGLASWSDSLVGVLGAVVADGSYDRTWLGKMVERLDELGERDDRAFLLALAELVWGKGSRNARVIGPKVADIDDAEAKVFRDRYLTARRGTLIVTGAFDPKLLLPHIRRAFAGLRAGSSDRAIAELSEGGELGRPAGLAIRMIPARRAADRLMVTLSLAVPVPAGTDRAAVRVLAQLVDDMAHRVRSELGAAYAAGALLDDEPGGTTLRIQADVDRDRAAAALRRIRTDLAALVAGGDDLVGRFLLARRQVVSSLLVHGTSARELAELLADEARRGRRPDQPSELARQVAATKLSQVQALAAVLLRPEAQSIVLRGTDAAMRAALRGAGLDGTVVGR